MAYANLTPQQRRNLQTDLDKLLASQKLMTENSGDYYKILKQVKAVQREMKMMQDAITKQQTKTAAAAAAVTTATAANKAAAQAVFEYEEAIGEKLKEKLATLTEINKELVKQAKNCNMITGILKTGLKDIVATKKALTNLYNTLQIADIFKMSKSIKMSALSMGVLGSQADSFSKDIQAAALETIEFGVGIEDIAKIQSTYSEELGRTVMLGTKGGIALGEMATATGLGAEGAASMAASLDMVGLSAERTADYVNQVMNDSHAMGLNSSKVIKNIQSNIKLLNRYNFKKGIQGLAKMAESTTLMGVNMEMVAPMADKLFDIEGAVEMSAQLQVLGGEWSKLADPFKLMYMARNDMEGLTDSVIKATASTAQFNKKTGTFDISALEMQRLRKVAEATGLNFEELAQSAKKAAQFASARKQMSFTMDDKTQEFIEATSTFDENGKAQIVVNGSNKYLSTLSENDKVTLKKIAADSEDMKKRAKESVTLDEMLGNTITMLKQMAIPFVEALNTSLRPMVDNFVKTIKDPSFQKTIKSVVDGIAKFVVGTAKFITEFPLATAGLFVLFEAAKWIGAGMMVGLGFNKTAGMGVGGGMAGKLGRGAMAGGFGGLMGYGAGTLASSAAGQKSTGTGDMASLAGTIVGGIIGSLGGPMGTMIGAGIGSSIGKFFGDKFSQPTEGTTPTTYNDAVVKFNPKDKFMKVNDGTMIAGTSVNGNKDLANALNASIPQLPNKAALMNSTQGSNVPSTTSPSIPSSITINFGELKFGGSIELTNGQNVTSDMGKQLINTPSFVRDMSKMVHQQTNSAVQGMIKTALQK